MSRPALQAATSIRWGVCSGGTHHDDGRVVDHVQNSVYSSGQDLSEEGRAMTERWRTWAMGLMVVLLASISVHAADDHGNSPLAATPIVVDESWEDGCIEAAGDADYFMFPVDTGRSYRLQVDGLGEASDPVIYLLAGDGLRIADVDDNSGGGSSALIRWTSDVSATWFAMVRQASALSGTGCYRLTLSLEASDDHGDSPLEATAMDQIGTWVVGAIENAEDCDVFFVSVSRGYEYSVELLPRGGSARLSLEVIDSEGRTIYEESGAGAEEGVTSVIASDAAGPWFLKVCSPDRGEGAYELRVVQEGYDDEHGDRAAEATPIPTEGGSISGTLEVDIDEDWFSLSVVPGASYMISTDVPNGEGPGGGVRVALRSQAGLLLVPEAIVPRGTTGEVTWTAGEEGTVYFQVRTLADDVPVPYTIDLRVVLTLTPLASVNPQGYTLDADGDASSSIAYFVVGTKGLFILDLTDPEDPVAIGEHTTRGYAQSIDVVGDIAYIASRGDGIVLIDVSNPERPTELAVVDTGGSSRDVQVADGIAYVADQRGGVQLIDVTDPLHPVQVGTWLTRGFAEQIEVDVERGLAAVATGDAGVELLDVSDPSNPRLIGSIETAGEARDVELAGSFAYVALGYRGIAVFDLATPAAPRLVNTVSVAGEVQSLALADEDRILLAAADAEGVLAFDLRNPLDPVLASVLETPGHAVSIHVAGDLIYVADLEDGLLISSLYPRE